VSTLPKGFRGTNACAEIKIRPSGRFASASNRGHDSIAAFALHDDGRLSPTGHFPAEKTPRSFDADPVGEYPFAAGGSSGKPAGYRIDPMTGKPRRLTTYEAGKMPWWVMAVELTAK
jgi:6-phosphogluconolactonase